MKIKTTDEMKRLNFLTGEIEAAYHKAALKFNLSDSAMMILYTIYTKGGSCMLNEITRFSGTCKQTINSALRKLESDNIVFSEYIGRKKKKIYLTEKGSELTDKTVYRLIEIENKILDEWSFEEREAYLNLTQKYLRGLNEKLEKL